MHKPTAMDFRKHEKIKMELRLADSSLADISRTLELHQSTVTSVSQGYGRSERIQNAIAAKLGKSPKEIWPKRYRTREA